MSALLSVVERASESNILLAEDYLSRNPIVQSAAGCGWGVRRLALVAVVAAVLVAAIAGGPALVFWPPSSVPFGAAHFPLGGAIAWGPDGKSSLYYRSVSPPFGDGKTTFVLRFRPHSQFRFGVGIPNTGRSPVRIDGIVTTSPDYAGMLRITGLQMQHKPNAAVLAGATSEPLLIKP
jgi:hypothetical protein